MSRILRLLIEQAKRVGAFVRRYERENPGELIHLDIKKLGKIGSLEHRITGRRTGVVNRYLGIGCEFVHVCIDDASRIAFSRIMKITKESASSTRGLRRNHGSSSLDISPSWVSGIPAFAAMNRSMRARSMTPKGRSAVGKARLKAKWRSFATS